MVKPKRSKEMYATQKMLIETREELKKDITSAKLELKSDIKKVEFSVERLEAKLGSSLLEFNARLDRGLLQVNAKIDAVLAAIHRVTALVEEQENRNKYVLDGYQSLYDRQERVEADIIELKKHRS